MVKAIGSGLPDSVKRLFLPVNLLYGAIAAAIVIVLSVISLRNYLFFHGIVEIAGIAVLFSIFIIIWNTRRVVPDAFFLIIGISFLFIGGIDLVHTLTFRGMTIIPGDSTNISTQLWIAARYFQSITFIIATFFIGRSLTTDRNHDVLIILTACTTACIIIFASIFVWPVFPSVFVEGSGLTQFKIISEYLISLILAATIIILYRKRKHFDPVVWQLLIAAQAFLILGELAFTCYVNVYGFMNLLGHLFRFLSVYFFYRAFVVTSLVRPYDLLLLKIRIEENELRERYKELTCMVHVSALMEQAEASLPQILEKTVHLIPPAMQYPDSAQACIELEGQTFSAADPVKPPWTLSREIRVNGNPVGRLAVWYREERPADHEGPFTLEERNLINMIAERIGNYIERTRARETLRESERRYRSFVQSFQGIAYLSTADWTPVFFHGAVEEITGYTERDFVTGSPRWDQVIRPSDLAEIRKRDNEKLLNVPGCTLQREYRIIRKDGEERWVSDFIQNWMDERGILLLSGVLIDITGRKRVEEALENSRALLATTQRLSKMGGWEWDVVRQTMTWTDETYRIHGFLPVDLTGGSTDHIQRSLACYDPGDRPAVEAAFRACAENGIPYDMEVPFSPVGGSRIWVRTMAQPVLLDGRIVKVVGNIMDITGRKQAEEALRSANRKLNLLSGITRHDIKNQLTILSGFLEISRQSLSDPAATAAFIAKAENAAAAINRQISFTKDYENLGVKSAVWQDVSTLVKTAIAALPMRNITVDIQCAGLEVFADPLLEKVFYNLIDNSLHYGGEKMTAIRVHAREQHGNLRIIYTDDGAGISADDKPQLFTKGFGKHTGLGLFLSREILSITGITITENGEPGDGARFEMTVPKGMYRFAAGNPAGTRA